MLNVILPDGAKYEGDHMADNITFPKTEDRDRTIAQLRDLALVAAELQHAQKVAATVKPLREELDRLLGKRTRAKKGGVK